MSGGGGSGSSLSSLLSASRAKPYTFPISPVATTQREFNPMLMQWLQNNPWTGISLDRILQPQVLPIAQPTVATHGNVQQPGGKGVSDFSKFAQMMTRAAEMGGD